MTSRRRRTHGGRAGGDGGAVILVFAASLVFLLLLVAFAVDLGQARSSKRSEQSAVDVAALDAGWFLSGRGNSGTPVSRPREACVAAVQSVQRNVADFAPPYGDAAITTDCAALPVTQTACTASPTPTDVRFVAGPYVLTVRYPLPTNELDTTGFAGGVGVDDGTEQCERMQVELAKTDSTQFAGVVGIDELETVAKAVVRTSTSSLFRATAALLLLERVGCGALQTSGGGQSGSGIYVQRSSPNVPGIIAADSAGQVPPCTENDNANGWVVYGTALPAAGGGGPSITAEDASPTIPGIIAIVAVGVGGRGGYTAPTGLNVEPREGTINSRNVSDERYNGANAQISTLHAQAEALTATAPAGYAVVSGAECGGAVDPATLVAVQVFVDCPTFQPDANIFPNAVDFVVRGNVEIGSNKVLSLPAVRRFYVRGCRVSGCSGSNRFAVDVANNGRLLVNTGEATIPTPGGGTNCAGRAGPGAGGTTTNTTKLATLGGDFDVSGFARLCQTTVYVGDDSTAHSKLSQTASNIGPENYPPIARCSPALPCPSDTAAPLSTITFNGGGGSADWSAPNQLSVAPMPADLAWGSQPFEDLALWTETSGGSDIKGLGTNSTQGVFFLPNAPFTFRGQGTQLQPLNAQFLARTLNVSGQGNLVMRPNPADSLEATVAGDIALIR